MIVEISLRSLKTGLYIVGFLSKHELPRRRGLLGALRIAVLVTMGILVGAEAAAQVWLASHPIVDVAAFLRSRPLPYQNAPYWSSQFVQEMLNTQENWYLSDGGYWLPHDFQGKYFNVENGMRHTAFQPTHALHTVYLIGNSSLYDHEVPDEATVASQLQLLLNARYGTTYRVLNLGAIPAIAFQQLERLKSLKLSRGDIVIFYDGAAEALSVYYAASNDHWSHSLRTQVCGWLLQRVGFSALVKISCELSDQDIPELTDDAYVQKLINTAQIQYFGAIREAAQYSRSNGAQFYHFLQPHIWTRPLSPYEEELAANPYLVPKYQREVTLKTWANLQPVTAMLTRAGIATWDFTHILDSTRAQGKELYLNSFHLNEVGNAIIARAMFDSLYFR